MFSERKDQALFTYALKGSVRKEDDLQKIETLVKDGSFSKMVAETAADAAPEIAAGLLKTLKASAPSMLRERSSLFRGFQARLYRTWRRPLDLLEMLIVIATESGEAFSDHWPWSKDKDQDLVFDVIRSLHARGCQISEEILTLLKAGFSSAAHARWRALHETNVTAMFIAEHGRDTAERYLLHEHIESHKAALVYQKHHTAIRHPPMSKAELDKQASMRDRLVAQYGKAFKSSYGWAAAALQRIDEGVRFSDIEDSVKLDHLRPFYKMASHPVHASSKALSFRLELSPHQRGPRHRLLLTGPSNLGLADPGHSAANSLSQLTMTFITRRGTFDTIFASRLMLDLTEEIGDAFIETHKAVEARTKANLRRRARSARPRTRTARPERG